MMVMVFMVILVAAAVCLRMVMVVARVSVVAAARTVPTAWMLLVGVVSVMMVPLIVVGLVIRQAGHVVATVRQMGRVLHAHLVAVVVWNVTLRRLNHRGLNVRYELSHLGAF